MIVNSLFAFLHFVAAFGIVCTLFFEWLTFSKNPSLTEATHIQLCDRWYGILAAAILAIGFVRVYYFEKGSDYYFSSPFFRVKLGLFVLIGLLSIYPTVKFLAWRKQTKAGMPPTVSAKEFTAISRILNLELCLLVALVLSASLMAKGA